MRADDQWLIVIIADDTYSLVTMHLDDIILEFRPELAVRDVVDVSLEAYRVNTDQTTTVSPQVRVVVRAVENVCDYVRARCSTEEATHGIDLMMIERKDEGQAKL